MTLAPPDARAPDLGVREHALQCRDGRGDLPGAHAAAGGEADHFPQPLELPVEPGHDAFSVSLLNASAIFSLVRCPSIQNLTMRHETPARRASSA